MAAVAAGAMIIGTGIQVYGAIKSAEDQAAMDETRAKIAQQQSAEIADREQTNEALRNQAAVRQKLQFGAAYAASGKAGSGVGSQLQIQSQADTQNLLSSREAAFQEKMLQQQAGIDTTLADQSRESGYLTALGAGIGGAGKAGSVAFSGGANPGYGGTQSLGGFPSSNNFQMPALGAGQFGGG